MLKRFIPIIALTALCWLAFGINNLILGGHLTPYGIAPRHLSSLPTILWAPFLHASFQHLAANTPPLLILGAIICGRSKSEFAIVALAGILMTGALTWLLARPGSHVGASGLIFCFFGYLGSLAYFKRTIGALFLSVACVLAYGGMLRGLLPSSAAVSWEGHIAGLLTGIAVAWLYSKLEKPAIEPGATTANPKLALETLEKGVNRRLDG